MSGLGLVGGGKCGDQRFKKKKDGYKPSDLSELLCAHIVDELFINGAGKKAKRLILELEDGRDGGGWCKEAVRDLILRHMGI